MLPLTTVLFWFYIWKACQKNNKANRKFIKCFDAVNYPFWAPKMTELKLLTNASISPSVTWWKCARHLHCSRGKWPSEWKVLNEINQGFIESPLRPSPLPRPSFYRYRDAHDELAKNIKNYADDEEINESLSTGLKSFTNAVTIAGDYMDINVHRMELKVWGRSILNCSSTPIVSSSGHQRTRTLWAAVQVHAG